MKIQAISSYNSANKNQTKNNASLGKKPSFKWIGADVSFNVPTAWYWSVKKLRILERTQQEMKDLAEYFHDCGKDVIKNICKQAHNGSSESAEKASIKLFDAVQNIHLKKPSMNEAELKKLSDKASIRESVFMSEPRL